MLPVVLVLAIGHAVTSVADIAAGRVSAPGELAHLPAPAGAFLLQGLRRPQGPPGVPGTASTPGLRVVEDPERQAG